MLTKPDESADNEDALEQAFVLQRIAHTKMWTIRLSVMALAISLGVLTALLIVATA
jgi:hypothetical protein